LQPVGAIPEPSILLLMLLYDGWFYSLSQGLNDVLLLSVTES
jgi:hypothetical protein